MKKIMTIYSRSVRMLINHLSLEVIAYMACGAFIAIVSYLIYYVANLLLYCS